MKANKQEMQAVFPPDKLVVLEQFLDRHHTGFLKETYRRRGGPNITVFDFKSLLSGSNTTSNVLARYQKMTSKTHRGICFVPPTLFRVLSQAQSFPQHLKLDSFETYRFIFWSINILGKRSR